MEVILVLVKIKGRCYHNGYGGNTGMNEQQIRSLSLNSLNFIIKLWESKNNISVAEGAGEGASAKMLEEKGIVEKWGRVPASAGKRGGIRWLLHKGKFKQKDIDLMKKITNIT